MLSGVFLARWPGSSGFRASRERLEDALSEAVARGRAAWPQLALDVDGFVAHVAMRVPADRDLEAALAGLHAGDLYLAYRCVSGDAEALAAFEAAQLGELGL